MMSGVTVITEDLKTHPSCPHGPTILFSRYSNGVKRNFFACSACRDRKDCSFFLYEDEKHKYNKKVWNEETKKFLKGINHRKLFLMLTKMTELPPSERGYCYTCSRFEISKFWSNHTNHQFIRDIPDHELTHPSEFLKPLENSRKEAQYLFAQSSVRTIIKIFHDLKYKKVLSISAPRLHEYVKQNTKMDSLLMDIDDRFHSFYGPLEFCWYNLLNHHFFLPEAENVFLDFINTADLVLVVDPPFGCRVEALSHTIKTIFQFYKKIRGVEYNLPVFLVFPYFQEPYIVQSLPDFTMLDYKVNYENHALFQDEGPKARKTGSPVRLYTNVDPSKIILPESEGYKFCSDCNRWVSQENQHCEICRSCTSKCGRTYIHCSLCERCVKPTWSHCTTCKRCAHPSHKCGEFEPNWQHECFNCKKPGHKKRDCPEQQPVSNTKRKLENPAGKSKKSKKRNKAKKIKTD